MFERYLTDALTTHFGHFVENLDADKVRISAWNGEVVLQDLSLRPNALEFMIPDCPVELTFGRVGHLELRIPWSLFRSQLRWKPGQQHRYLSTSSPCSIVLSDVNILITPRRRRDSQDQPPELEEGETEEVEDNVSIDQRRILKEKQVQSMLDGNLLRRVTESSVTSSRWSWVQDWLSTLLSTLSVTIRNIHIRYEDPGTCMGFVWDTTTTGPRSFCNKVPRSIRQYRPSFAIGITLRQFSVESEDQQLNKEEKESEGKNNLEVASSNVSSVVRRVPYALRKKLAEAESLAVYWDSDCNLMAMHSDTLCRGDDRSMEYSSYYHAAFRIANDNFSSSGHKAETETIFAHESLYKQQHSYVLDPISPSVNLTLVSPKNSLPSDAAHAAVSMESATSIDFSDDSSNDGSTIASTTGLQHSALLPPSSVRLHLPPCTLTLARSTLEDTAYIRKSLSIWRHATKGILSEATIRRLAKLRPSQSPKDDPRNWWHYAVEATLALSQFYKERRDRVNMEAKHRPRRRLGWKGFWEAYQLRKRYVTLYQALVPRVEPNPKTPELLDSNTAHKNLLEMEDELLTEEIVAFRLAFYESWKSAPLIHHHKTTKTETMTSSSGWQIWSKSFDKQTGDVLMADQIMLTLGHRLSMLEEMSLALQRERTNVLNIELEESRQASLQHLPALDHTDKKSCDEDTNPILWDASLACKEIAVQINDESADSTRFSNCTTPVLRFSCAWVQDQRWYQDGSWDIDCSLASLLVKDMTVSKTKNSHGYFPNLIARKVQHYHSSNTEDVIWIDGNPHHKGLSIAVRRNLHWNRDNASDEASDHVLLDIDRGSTTTSRIRIFPMEVVYSTVPVEVATRVLGAVKTTELVDDYHRMAAAAHGWQERQKKKFLAALAHKGKKIIVDVDVGAPELLIPEDINQPESPMLAIDLGRLRIFNDDVFIETSLEYDDQWRLALSDIQVRSATVASFGQEISLDTSTSAKFTHARSSPRQLVEPFSLDLIISTRIAVEETQDPIAQTKIRVLASLPRLAFNLNSSSIRLVSRLQQQWEMRRSQKNVHSLPPSLIIDMPTAQNNSSNRGTNLERYPDGESSIKETTIITNRVSQFDFTAPVIRLRLDSDTGDTRNGEYHTSIPLLDLAFRGIRGTLLQEFIATGESSMLFDARLHSLGVIDLYQTAGNDFALLMSSALPENLDGLVLDGETYSWAAGNAELKEFRSGKDLVTIKFSSTNAKGLDDLVVPDKLSIGFHELYVEWNPETIATIQKAIQIPDEAIYGPVEQIKDDECASVSDEEFFDAMENTTFVSEHEIASIRLLSEVASSSFDTAEPGLQSSLSRQSSWTSSALSLAIPSVFPNNGQLLISPHRMVHSAMRPFPPNHAAYPPQASDSRKIDSSLEKTEHVGEEKPFELKFELSKLRVSFNKESRYRKVMIAQMDGTIISYKTRTSGGSRTNMKIGNLVFTDPATTKNSTLYSQILGLKTGTEDAKGDQLSSLLEMEILVNPKTRSFEAGINQLDDSPSKPVEIDLQRGTVIGCNFFVRAKFSPMRFVFLEQLWFEFIDYFFEGIIGNAVWGGQRSGQLTSPLIESTIDVTSGSRYLPGSDAKGFNFTRFDIQLDTPELLFPVTYRSPHFLRLDLGSIHVTNKYDTTLIDSEGKDLRARMQWFNNCTVALDSLRIFSWTGQELGQNPFIASVALRWPIGPTARLVTPKWTVNCRIDSLDIALRRTDYALIQHIISNNIGEESRHLNEWQALQKLSQADIVAYTESILVHYGYDNKDVTPTTYDLKVTIPCVRVEFIEFEKDVTAPVSVARCIDLIWSLRKDSDLVIKQKATFDINLSAPSSSSSSGKLLSSWKYDQDILMEDAESDSNEDIPELTFTSTTLPNGDNTKTLEIVDACIYADFRAWRGLSGFFSALPEVSLMNADEIASSIQVGDRWYRIGGNAKHHSDMQIDDESATTFRWINSIPLLRNVVSTRPMLPVSQKSLWPTFQIRVTLTSPRIILSSDPVDGSVSRLVLRMSHFDFLQTNSGVNCKVTRSFFLDEVEVYTLSGKTSRKRKRQDGNSLIHPWSVGGIMEKCNGRSVGNCEKHYTKISADTLQARAAYSDMAIAIEVCLSVTQSSRIDNNQVGGISKSVSSDSFSETSQTTRTESQHSINTEVSNDDFCSTPKTSLFDVECEGFELLVEDDSGRHFATNQELIILSLDKVLFSRNEHHGKPSSLHLRLHGFDLFDCLQSSDSPFRTAASTRQGVTSLNKRGSGVETGSSYQFRDESPSSGSSVFCWDSYKMQEISDFKFKPSTTLLQRLNVSSEHCLYLLTDNGKENSILPSRMIEVTCIFATRAVQKYHIKLHSLSVQWNPSTVIAIQRFLGRLRKESNSKISQVFPGDIDHLIATKSMELDEEVVDAPSRSDFTESSTVEAIIELHELKVCLNKEHQNRRLLEMSLLTCRLELYSSNEGLIVDGQVGSLSAWDSDEYVNGIHPVNRHVVKVISGSPPLGEERHQNLLNLYYRTFKDSHSKSHTTPLPPWVQAHASEIGGIDDFLSVRVAATEFTYLKERTEEMVDYLSNGLPGKGMGVTSRAAKGFISKRILTKSFLEFQNDSPQIFLPQHELCSNGVSLKLGTTASGIMFSMLCFILV